MIRIPKFKSHVRVSVTSPDLVFFVQESGYRVLQGRILYLIAPFVDGRRTVRQIAAHLKKQATIRDVEGGLLLLDAEGYLVEGAHALPSGLELFRDSLNINPEIFADSLKANSVTVLSFSQTSTSRFVRLLKQLGIAVSKKGNFTVLLVEDYLHEELKDFNRRATQTKSPWMIIKPAGSVSWIGPIFSHSHGPCWNCLAERLKEKRRVDAFLRAYNSTENRPQCISKLSIEAASDAALNLAALQILKWITSDKSEQNATLLWTLDVKEMKLEKHAVIRREDCSVCGISGNAPAPPQISRHTVAPISDFPTFENYQHHISLRTGIVDEMKSFHAGTNGVIHSVVADHIFVPNLEKKKLLQKGLTQKSWGKGITEEQAKTSALCEALERYSGVFRGTEFRIEKSLNEIRDQAISIDSCLNFSDTQYKNRVRWNRSHADHDWVPLPFDPQRKTEWTPVWSLTNQIFRYLPTAYCYYGYPLHAENHFCRADSNGNAAGETLERAILNGFLEVVERDAAALWWFNRIKRPGVDLESFEFPYLRDLLRSYQHFGRDLWVLDITNDFEIPCFAALSANNHSTRPNFLMGLGAHFDPAHALTRAITEMNQFLPARMQRQHQRKIARFVPDQPFLRPNPDLPQTEFQYTIHRKADVRTCVQLAKKHGMETFVLDQTRSDVGLPVVKVIVPGMRQIWARFAPGRLYDVPVRLGWLSRPLKENQLNQNRFLI